MQRKFKAIIIGAAVAAGGLITGLVIKENVTNNNLMQANERMAQQSSYMDTLGEFIDQIDTVTASYISGNIDRDAYIERHNVLKEEFEIIKGSYSSWLDEHPIDLSSQSFISGEGETAVEHANTHTDELLTSTFKEINEPYDIQELAYRYLKAKENLQNDFIGYTAAYKWLQEADSVEEDFNNLVDELNEPVEGVNND